MARLRVAPAVLLSCVALAGHAQEPRSAAQPVAPEEAPLRVRYLPWVDALMLGVYKEGTFYLPAAELLRRVGVATELRHAEQRLSGFYLRAQDRYAIDLKARAATVGRRSVTIGDGEALVGELDLFLTPAVFERLFGWRVALDPLSLEVRIDSRDPLPVATAAMRRRRETGELSPDTSGAVRFARQRHVLYGGTLDYALNAERSAAGERQTLDLLIGAEAFAGELQGRVHGGDRRSGAALRATDLRWRYVVDNSAILSQIAIGNVVSGGPGATAVRGLQITNQPIETKAQFATRVLQGTTGPEWEVEVYVNERLVTRTSADPLGRYRAEVPVGYGSASMRVRFLGPGGEVREQTSRVEVPFTFLPPHRLAYVVTAGTKEDDHSRRAHAEVGAGITTWLTARSGVEIRDSRNDPAPPVTYHTLSARVGPNRILGVSVAPGASTRVSAEWLLASRAHFSATAARYGDEPRLNPRQLAWEWDGAASAPLRVGSVPLTIRLASGELGSESGPRLKRGEGEAIFGVGPWMPSVGYAYGPAAPSGELRATSLVFLGHRAPLLLRNAILRASVARPARDAVVNGHVEAGVLARLAADQRLDLSYRYLPESRASRFEMRLQLDTRSGRATTAHRREDGRASWSQSVAGSIAVDPRRAGVTLSSRPLVGRGGASMTFFLDENGNGRCDRGEVRVTGATARFNRVAELRTADSGEVIATELLAYHRYYAQVETRGVPNPLWRPQFTSFSFVADPNKFQTIAVPFHVASTAQGTVTRGGTDAARAVPGLRVHVTSADGSLVEIIPTFADGSFYHEGLPPGRYVVKLDSLQLDILAVTSSPSERIIDVRPGREGASVEGLDFVLVPRVRRP